jgi:hypothetical protein
MMSKDLVVMNEEDDFAKSIAEIEQTQRACQMLMKTPHYAKLGEAGIFAIVQKSRSIGLNVLDALNGSMYFVNGKVELAANAMNYLIRSKGHSITKDEKSNKEVCILRGKRCDNGDTWIASFSIAEAKLAGIYKNVWEKYPEDMLFARALTRLARQLFPDVIKGCYVEGEIQVSKDVEVLESSYSVKPAEKTVKKPATKVIEAPKSEEVKEIQIEVLDTITTDQAITLSTVLNECDPAYKEKIMNFFYSKFKCETVDDFPSKMFDEVHEKAKKNREEYQAALAFDTESEK